MAPTRTAATTPKETVATKAKGPVATKAKGRLVATNRTGTAAAAQAEDDPPSQKDAGDAMAPPPPYQVGDLIWYKADNRPWWPAKILERRDDTRVYSIHSFGDDRKYGSARAPRPRRWDPGWLTRNSRTPECLIGCRYDLAWKEPMRPYRYKEFAKMWKGLENSKSVERTKLFLVRREADAAESAAPAPAVAPASAPSAPSKKAGRGENDKGRKRPAAATEESEHAAPPAKKQAGPDKPRKQNRQAKAAKAPATAGPDAPTQRFRVGDLVWYDSKSGYPMWPGQIKNVDEANQRYRVDSFGDDWE